MYTFGDSTYSLTAKEQSIYLSLREDDDKFKEFEKIDAPTAEQIAELERHLTDMHGNGVVEYRRTHYPGFPVSWTIVATTEHTKGSLLSQQSLAEAYGMYDRLRKAEKLIGGADYLEAQLLGPVTANDCETIYLHESLRSKIENLLLGENVPDQLQQVAENYRSAITSGKIKYHNEK